MSRIDDFMQSCEQRGAATLDDHLWLSGFQYHRTFRSMRASAGRVLRKGERWRYLADDGVIQPTAGAPKESEWAKGLPKAFNKQPIKLESQALVPAKHAMSAALHLSHEARELVDEVIDSGLEGRVGKKVSASISQLIHENDLLEVRRQAEADRRLTLEKAYEDLRRMAGLMLKNGSEAKDGQHRRADDGDAPSAPRAE